MQNCKMCSALWSIDKKLDVCPFCGADLKEKKIITSIEDAFQVIADKHGKEILKESRKFLGLLSDYAPELIKERNLIKMAVEIGAYKAIYEASIVSDKDKEQAVKKYALILHETFFIDEIWAEKVMVWCSNMISGNFEEQNCSIIENDCIQKDIVQIDEIDIQADDMEKVEDYYEHGMKRYYDKEVKRYEKIVKQGNKKAKSKLVDCYYKLGYFSNHNEAVKWYEKAAKQGHIKAQYNLGQCYEYGWGVEKNYSEAIKWYEKAVQQGHKTAQDKIKRLHKKKR